MMIDSEKVRVKIKQINNGLNNSINDGPQATSLFQRVDPDWDETSYNAIMSQYMEDAPWITFGSCN